MEIAEEIAGEVAKNVTVDCDGWTKREACLEGIRRLAAENDHVITDIKVRGGEVWDCGGSLKRLRVDIYCETLTSAIWLKCRLDGSRSPGDIE